MTKQDNVKKEAIRRHLLYIVIVFNQTNRVTCDTLTKSRERVLQFYLTGFFHPRAEVVLLLLF